MYIFTEAFGIFSAGFRLKHRATSAIIISKNLIPHLQTVSSRGSERPKKEPVALSKRRTGGSPGLAKPVSRDLYGRT